MKKRGFTLVELLAVIAILAVLVIIALPNVMSMFNSAKESTFTTELKRIYKGAEEKYVQDSFSTSGTKIYSKCNSGCTNELDMDVRDDLEYYIEVNSSGKVVKFYAKDKSFQYYHNGEMSINDIEKVSNIGSISENEKIKITSTGATMNGSNFITFNINYYYERKETKTYTALEGMTWDEWMNSGYNVDNIHFDSNHVCGDDIMKIYNVLKTETYANGQTSTYIDFDSEASSNEIIVDNKTYYFRYYICK